MTSEKFIGERLTELRQKKGVSEYQMSLDMGHSGSYINAIVSGKAMPSMREFLYICEYLEISPKDFFDESCENPARLQELSVLARSLSEDDLSLIISLISRIKLKG